MNRNEEIEQIKKELFKVDFLLKSKQYHSSEEHRTLLDNKKEYLDKIKTLQEEVALDDGQVGFAFTDLIETKGRKI